jgi:Uma2 family endonuclease
MSTTIQFTLEQYDRMIESGVLEDVRDRRLELVYGEIREMTPPGPTHEEVVDLLTRWSTSNTSPERVRVRVQNSIGIPALDSAPQPDIGWVREQSYRDQRPGPEDVLLVIEVSDSSLGYDLGEKLQLYAEAGVKEYWVVDIPHFQVHCFHEPHGRTYRHKRSCGLDATLAPRALKSVKLPVATLFRS